MRALTIAVILLSLTGCASNAQPRSLDVQVFEQRGQYHAASVQGQHLFVVRITNRSQESVMINSISLGSFSNQIVFYNGDQTVGQALEPEQTQDFSMFVDVAVTPQTRVYTIDSIDVSINCASNAKGEFTETSSQSVRGM